MVTSQVESSDYQVLRISDFLELYELSVLTYFFRLRIFIYSLIFSSPFHQSPVHMQKEHILQVVQIDELSQNEHIHSVMTLIKS